MVDVALHIDHRRICPARNFAHVRVALAGNQVVTDGDGVSVAGENDSRVLGAFSVGDLHDIGGQKMGVAAKLRHSRLERVTRARGLVEEHQEDGFIGQIAMWNARLEFTLQIAGYIEQDFDLCFAVFLRGDVVLAFKQRFSRFQLTPLP